MKVELTENGVRLIPETELEKIACKNLAKARDIQVTCLDDWHHSGPIVLNTPKNDWDQNHSGNR